jgi:hypothetical protein
VLLRFDACLKLDFLAPAVLTILVGGFMRLAFFAWWRIALGGFHCVGGNQQDPLELPFDGLARLGRPLGGP